MEESDIVIAAISAGVPSLTFAYFVLKHAFKTGHRLTTVESALNPLPEAMDRLSRIETKVEEAVNGLKERISDLLVLVGAPGNPMSQERWEELLGQLRANTISEQDAVLLNEAMLERQEEAKNKNEGWALLAIAVGLALLAVYLNSKE
ncbi:MAG: hypothetical protein CL902_04320 [Dehalococcoidia bacterium]|nr:hypothetical protein [Dehalococcoidia bacterium]